MNFTVNNPLISTKILSVTFYHFTVCLNHVSIHPFIKCISETSVHFHLNTPAHVHHWLELNVSQFCSSEVKFTYNEYFKSTDLEQTNINNTLLFENPREYASISNKIRHLWNCLLFAFSALSLIILPLTLFLLVKMAEFDKFQMVQHHSHTTTQAMSSLNTGDPFHMWTALAYRHLCLEGTTHSPSYSCAPLRLA